MWRVQSATMFGMDPEALASRMRRLQSWMESKASSPTWSRHQFDRPPFGNAEVTVDATSNSPAASFNRNRICLCGSEGGLTRDGLTEMIQLFDAQRVKRFFVATPQLPDAGSAPPALVEGALGRAANEVYAELKREIARRDGEPPQAA